MHDVLDMSEYVEDLTSARDETKLYYIRWGKPSFIETLL